MSPVTDYNETKKSFGVCNGVKILVVTGSSGGHIFPALGFLHTLKVKHEDIEALLVLPKKRKESHIENFECRVNYISTSSIKLRPDFKNCISLFNFFKGSFESLFILLNFRPDIVVGFGSLVSVPMVMFAWCLRMKTMIHEQNVIPGRANKFLAKFVDRIAISFAQTKNYLKDYEKKIVLTGNPLRKQIIHIDKNKALDFFGFSKEKFTILVMGGSLGSHKINQEFFRAISTISDKTRFQIIHLVGRDDLNFLEHSYKDLNLSIRLFSFFNSMQYAYSACDLVVSRAGATTLAEIIFFRVPAIIIPYPFAYRHQRENARVLERIASAVIIEDTELDAGILRQTIEDLATDPGRLKTMRQRYDTFSRFDTNSLFVDSVLSL